MLSPSLIIYIIQTNSPLRSTDNSMADQSSEPDISPNINIDKVFINPSISQTYRPV